MDTCAIGPELMAWRTHLARDEGVLFRTTVLFYRPGCRDQFNRHEERSRYGLLKFIRQTWLMGRSLIWARQPATDSAYAANFAFRIRRRGFRCWQLRLFWRSSTALARKMAAALYAFRRIAAEAAGQADHGQPWATGGGAIAVANFTDRDSPSSSMVLIAPVYPFLVAERRSDACLYASAWQPENREPSL